MGVKRVEPAVQQPVRPDEWLLPEALGSSLMSLLLSEMACIYQIGPDWPQILKSDI